MLLNIDDNRIALSIMPIWRLAFRSLFLGGSLFSVLAIAWWAYYWHNPFSWLPYGGPVWWHSHEMIFGFVAAIVTGFLLTAEQTWTGVIGLRGKPLAALFFLWLSGRVVFFLGGYLPATLVGVIDGLFLPAATLAIAIPIIQVKQWRNIGFVLILLALSCANLLSHFFLLSAGENGNAHVVASPLSFQIIHSGIILVALIIAILGGRVIPFFTANGTGTKKNPPIKWLDMSSLISLSLIAIALLPGMEFLPDSIFIVLCLIGSLTHAWRASRWGGQHCFQTPLLWSLHLSYWFIPVGLLALAGVKLQLGVSLSAALHCFTAGAMGGLILAMMSRVSLGHTGRQLVVSPIMILAFACIFMAGCVRVIIPVVFPAWSTMAVMVSAFFWVLSFSIFVYKYAAILCQARADKRPG